MSVNDDLLEACRFLDVVREQFDGCEIICATYGERDGDLQRLRRAIVGLNVAARNLDWCIARTKQILEAETARLAHAVPTDRVATGRVVVPGEEKRNDSVSS